MMQRLYAAYDVSKMTLFEVQDLIESEGIDYSGDYGFEVTDNARLIYSEN